MDDENNQNQNGGSKLRFGKRTYFFDIKDAANGSKYLKVTESRFVKEGERRRNTVVFFKDDVKEFASKLKEMAKEL